MLGTACYGTSHHGDTGWHVDRPRELPRGLKFSIYLSPTRADAGALRLLPGSHRSPYHDEVRSWLHTRPDPASVPCTLFESEPGDIVIFDLRLFHAALGGGRDRRALTVQYYANPRTAEEEQLVREQVIED